MSFLKAQWRKLAIANYEIDPSLLSGMLPYGTEVDLWQGKCYVSLVGFMFLNTKMLGLKIPFHVNFEEVNLRFYVKRLENNAWKRGVVFIKEIVPRPAVTFIANTFYQENYVTLPMKHSWLEREEERLVEYRWRKNGKWQGIKVKASIASFPIAENTEAAFITEHYWGYAKVSNLKTNEYEVRHPRWTSYEVMDYAVEVDFKEMYGPAFDFLTRQQPVSVLLAEGSEISVELKKWFSKPERAAVL